MLVDRARYFFLVVNFVFLLCISQLIYPQKCVCVCPFFFRSCVFIASPTPCLHNCFVQLVQSTSYDFISLLLAFLMLGVRKRDWNIPLHRFSLSLSLSLFNTVLSSLFTLFAHPRQHKSSVLQCFVKLIVLLSKSQIIVYTPHFLFYLFSLCLYMCVWVYVCVCVSV